MHQLIGVFLLLMLLVQHSIAQEADTIAPVNVPNSEFRPANNFFNGHMNMEKYKNNISAFGEWFSNSDAMTAGFTYDLIFANFIDEEAKNNVSEKLNEKNSFGAEIAGGLSYMRRLDHFLGGNSLFISKFAYNNIYSASFHPDVFELIFRGNAYFEGDSAILTPAYFHHLSYTQLKAGLYKELVSTPEKSIGLGVMLGYNMGYNYNEVDITKGSLYTAPEGEYLDLIIGGSAIFSDTAYWDEMKILGNGLSADLIFSYTAKYAFKVELLDIGYLKFNENTITFSSDTAFTFDGFEASDLFSAGSVFEQTETDSLLTLLAVQNEKASKTIALPATARITVGKALNENIYLTAGAQYKYLEVYDPLFFIVADKKWDRLKLKAGISGAYGGYGGFIAGARIGKYFGDRFFINAGSTNLLALALPDKLTGSSIYLNVSASF